MLPSYKNKSKEMEGKINSKKPRLKIFHCKDDVLNIPLNILEVYQNCQKPRVLLKS